MRVKEAVTQAVGVVLALSVLSLAIFLVLVIELAPALFAVAQPFK